MAMMEEFSTDCMMGMIPATTLLGMSSSIPMMPMAMHAAMKNRMGKSIFLRSSLVSRPTQGVKPRRTTEQKA